MRTSKNTESKITGEKTVQLRAEILILESTKIEQSEQDKQDWETSEVQSGRLRSGKTEQNELWRRVGYFPIAPGVYADDNDVERRSLEEMVKAKWEWREVMIV